MAGRTCIGPRYPRQRGWWYATALGIDPENAAFPDHRGRSLPILPFGERPRGRPITPQMMIATLYRVLGIDLETTLPDHNGRAVYLLDQREPINELF